MLQSVNEFMAHPNSGKQILRLPVLATILASSFVLNGQIENIGGFGRSRARRQSSGRRLTRI